MVLNNAVKKPAQKKIDEVLVSKPGWLFCKYSPNTGKPGHNKANQANQIRTNKTALLIIAS